MGRCLLQERGKRAVDCAKIMAHKTNEKAKWAHVGNPGNDWKLPITVIFVNLCHVTVIAHINKGHGCS